MVNPIQAILAHLYFHDHQMVSSFRDSQLLTTLKDSVITQDTENTGVHSLASEGDF